MSPKPRISVVICSYNRKKFIPACIACLAAQTLPTHEWEGIFVDNASTDGTAELVQAQIAAYPQLPMRYVFEANKGLSFARNRGIAEAQTNLITFIDDDAEAVPAFLAELLSFLDDHPQVGGVGGRVIPKYSESPEPPWMNKYLNGFVGRVEFGNSPLPYQGYMKYPIGCNMTYRKNLMVQAGGFNNQLTFRGDDKHIFYAVTKLNPSVYYLPSATVYHNIDAARLSFESFKKLFLKTGNEERIRVQQEGGPGSLILKLIEYLAKLGAAAIIWLNFALHRQEPKGRYTFYSQWFTLKGFLKKSVFVR